MMSLCCLEYAASNRLGSLLMIMPQKLGLLLRYVRFPFPSNSIIISLNMTQAGHLAAAGMGPLRAQRILN